MHLLSAYAVGNPRLKKNEKKTADMVQTNMLAFMKSFCQQPVLADHIGNTGLWILASSFSIYSTGVR